MYKPIVSFDTAKSLKNKYTEFSDTYYWITPSGRLMKQGGGAVSCLSKKLQQEYYPAPVAEDVIRWLRINKNIFVTVSPCIINDNVNNKNKISWIPCIRTLDSTVYEPSLIDDDYDVSCEKTVKFVFDNVLN